MAQATQPQTDVKKPRSEFRVEFDEPDAETGVQHIEINADLYVRSAPEIRGLLSRLANHLSVDHESGNWRND